MDYIQLSGADCTREWAYVKQCLEGSSFDSFGGGKVADYPFRSRFQHTTRVMLWAQRILADCPQVDRRVLELAIIFHDVGYSKGVNKSHQEAGAQIFEEYCKLQKGDIWDDADRLRTIAWMIRNHSRKEMLSNGEATPELTLLMEADMLDEEGAMRITWDAMATGFLGEGGFEETLKRTIRFWDPEYMPMVTPLATDYFKEKQFCVEKYIAQMKFDLGLDRILE